MLRTLKDLGKLVVRSGIKFRLNTFPVTEDGAEWWAEQIKRWPAVLGNGMICRRIQLDHQIKMDVGLVDVIERNLWVNGIWDQPIKDLMTTLLRPGDHFLDLGANIGYFTLLASQLVGPTGSVVAVEPSIRALRKLTNHVWLNECSNVLVVSCAAGSERSQTRISLATESNIGGSSLANGSAPLQRSEPVWVAPIDEVLGGMSFHPKLIKIDVEGYELAALRGVQRLLEADRPWIACEITEGFLRRFGHSAAELVGYLSSLGYQPYALERSQAFTPIAPSELSDPDRQFNVVFIHADSPAHLPASA